MRKMMSKEITVTEVTLGKVSLDGDEVKVNVLEPVKILGTTTQEKLQKRVLKDYPLGTTILKVEETTKVYEMEVEKFIKLAKLKEDSTEDIEEVESEK